MDTERPYTGNSPQPRPMWPVGGDQPRVNAGSPTYPLDVAAAFTADRKRLTVAVLNPTESAEQVSVSFKGVELADRGRVWRMTGPNAGASNQLGQKPQVDVTESLLTEAPKTLSAAPLSINIYEFEVR
jgi:alpha-N-arabinofuranosidase